MVNDWKTPPMSAFNVKCAGHEGAGYVHSLLSFLVLCIPFSEHSNFMSTSFKPIML